MNNQRCLLPFSAFGRQETGSSCLNDTIIAPVFLANNWFSFTVRGSKIAGDGGLSDNPSRLKSKVHGSWQSDPMGCVYIYIEERLLSPITDPWEWYIYLHEWLLLMVTYGKCRQIYFTWMLWVIEILWSVSGPNLKITTTKDKVYRLPPRKLIRMTIAGKITSCLFW